MNSGATAGSADKRSNLRAFGLGGAIAVIITLVKLAFGPHLGREAPLSLFGVGIVLAGWRGGARAAAVTTVLASLSCLFFFLGSPGVSLLADPPILLQLGALLIEGTAISAIAGLVARGRALAETTAERVQRLQTLTAALAVARSAEEVGDVMIHQAVAVLGPSTGALAVLRDDGKLELLAHHGQTAETLRAFSIFSPDDPLPAARAFRSGNVEWIEDPQTFAAAYPLMVRDEVHGKAAAVSFPLISYGRVLGATTYRFDQPRRFAEPERDLLRSFASLAAQALDRVLTAQREAAFRQRLEALDQLSTALAAAQTREEVAAVVVQRGMKAMSADSCTLYVVDDGDGSLELIGDSGVAPELVRRISRIPRDSANPVASTLSSAKPLWAESEEEYQAMIPGLASSSGARAKAFWSFPLIVEGQPFGLLGMGFYEGRRFPAEERAFIQTFTGHCAQALRRSQRLETERTSRRAAERAQVSLATTLRSIGDAVITTDADGLVTFMNPVAEQLTGWRQEDAHGKPLPAVFRIVDEGSRQEAQSPVDRVLRQGGVVGLANHTLLLGLNTGQETPIDHSGAPIRDGAGEIQGVVLVFRDVRAKKDDEARRAFAADVVTMLGTSLDREATLGKLAQAVVPRLADWCAVDIVDGADGRPRRLAVTHVDPAKVELAHELARRFPEPPHSPTGVFKVLRTGQSEFYPTITEEMIRRGARGDQHARILLDLQLRSLMIVPLLARGRTLGALTFVSAESGRTYGADDLAFAEDLARRAAVAIDNAQLYSAEQHARRAADVANRAKDEFLATVSHELRTPLTAILGWSRLMARGGLDQIRQTKAVTTIERNALAMVQLIEDLLDISRIISGRLRLDVQPVELPQVIAAAVDSVRPAIDAKGLSLQVEENSDVTITVGDPTRLQQVMWNLLSNAVKFTPKAGRIGVNLQRKESWLVVSVSDTGKGIEPAFLPHVFDPFRQADSTIRRAHGGLGLGLAITRQLVELHGGSIAVNSAGEGHGTTFQVTLPISAVRADPEAVPQSLRGRELSQATFDVPPQLAGLKVLVVDDETDTRQLIRAILESCSVQVGEAASVAEAIAALEQEIPDVVISDLGMPVEDGYVLIRKIRALPAARGGSVPVLALTAFTRAEDRQAALKAGFTLHLPKPVDPAELVAVMAGLPRFG
jgi:PAS domain S-box-containing protein